MSNVLNRATGATAPYWKDYRTSVNTSDFPTADWIINPDLSAVEGQPSKYWLITGDAVSLVDPATQASRDAEIDALNLQAEKDGQKSLVDNERFILALVKVLIDEINLLRQQFNTTTSQSNQLTTTNLSDRTLAQARTAIFNEIDA